MANTTIWVIATSVGILIGVIFAIAFVKFSQWRTRRKLEKNPDLIDNIDIRRYKTNAKEIKERQTEEIGGDDKGSGAGYGSSRGGGEIQRFAGGEPDARGRGNGEYIQFKGFKKLPRESSTEEYASEIKSDSNQESTTGRGNKFFESSIESPDTAEGIEQRGSLPIQSSSSVERDKSFNSGVQGKVQGRNKRSRFNPI